MRKTSPHHIHPWKPGSTLLRRDRLVFSYPVTILDSFLQHPPHQSPVLCSQVSIYCTIHLHRLMAQCSTSKRERKRQEGNSEDGWTPNESLLRLVTLPRKGKFRWLASDSNVSKITFQVLSFHCRPRKQSLPSQPQIICTFTKETQEAVLETRKVIASKQTTNTATRNNALRDTNSGTIF